MEVAALGLKIDGIEQVNRAATSLGNLSNSSKQAEQSAGRLAGASKKSSRDIDEFAQSSRRAEQSTDRLAVTAKRAAGVIVGAFAGIKLTGLIKEVALANSRFEQLGAVMGVVGRNAGLSATEMNRYAKEVEGMGISLTESRNTVIRMVQAQLDLSKASELARLAQDAAVIANTNSSDALGRLIYGLQSGQVEILRTMGLNVNFANSYTKLSKELGVNADQLTEAQKAQARMNAVMEAGIQIAGAYDASMDSAAKQLGSTVRYVQDLAVTIGGVFSDATIQAVFSYSDALKEMSDRAKALAEDGTLANWSKNLADFMRVAADAAALLAIAIGSKLAGSLAASAYSFTLATAEAVRYQAALARMAGMSKFAAARVTALGYAAGAARGAMALLGGPAGVAFAAAGAILYFATRTSEAEREAEALEDRLNKLGDSFDRLNEAQARAAILDYNKKLAVATRELEKQNSIVEYNRKLLEEFPNASKAAQWQERLTRAAGAAADAQDEVDRLNEALARLNKIAEGGGAGKTTVALEEISIEAPKAAKGIAQLEASLRKAESAASKFEDELESILDSVSPGRRELREFERQMELLNEAAERFPHLASEIEAAMRALEDSFYAAQDPVSQLDEQLRESPSVWAEALQGAVERIDSAFVDMWRNIGRGFDSFADSLKNAFKQLLAELAHIAFTRRIVIGFGSMFGLGASGGALAGGGGGGGGVGLGDMLSLGNFARGIQSGLGSVGGYSMSALNWVGEAGSQALYNMGFQSAASSWSLGFSTFANGMVQAGNTIGGYVGMTNMSTNAAAGLGGLATAGAGYAGGVIGADLGRAITGKQGSGWGSAAGAVGGAYIGAAYGSIGGPIGAAIGAVIGALVDSIFGSSAWNTTRGGLQLGFSDAGFDPRMWERQTKKGGLFGSTKRRYRYSELDPEIATMLDDAYTGAVSSVASLYEQLGVTIEDGVLEAVRIASLDIGTAGKSKQTEEEIQQQVADWFASLQDAMVSAIDPSLNLETLSTYANSLTAVNTLFREIGVAALDLSIAGGQAASRLIALAGDFETFAASADFYFQNFFTEQEKFNTLQRNLGEAFGALNAALPTSVAEFRALVEAQDLMTEAGQEQFVALMALAPAVKQYTNALEEQARAAEEAAEAVRDAAKQELDRLVAGAFRALQRAVQAEQAAIQEQINAASAALAAAQNVAGILNRSLRNMRLESEAFDRQQRQAAQASLITSLAMYRAGGILPDADTLQRDLDIIARPSQQLFGSFEEYQRDFWRTANVIADLEQAAGEQVTIEQSTLSELESQSAALDGILANAQSQLDALNGVESGLLSVAEALARFEQVMGSARSAPRPPSSDPLTAAYQKLFGRNPDAAGAAYWQAELATGKLTLDQLEEALIAGALGEDRLKVRGFASGGYHSGGWRLVGENGPELEYTPASRIYSNAQSRNMLDNSEVVAELKQLRADMREQNRAIIINTARAEKMLERWDGEGMPPERETFA